jgi:hypothetical protein
MMGFGASVGDNVAAMMPCVTTMPAAVAMWRRCAVRHDNAGGGGDVGRGEAFALIDNVH